MRASPANRNSLGTSRQGSHSKTEGRGTVYNGLRFLNSRVGASVQWQQVSPTTFPLFMFLTFHRDARVLFKPGKNCDGYFTGQDLLVQVDCAIDIFKGKTKGNAQGLFLFDNAPSHQKRALNAISARKMPKSE
jgi:hypothetical protein